MRRTIALDARKCSNILEATPQFLVSLKTASTRARAGATRLVVERFTTSRQVAGKTKLKLGLPLKAQK